MTDHTHAPAKASTGSLPTLLHAYREQQDKMRALAAETSQLRQKVLVAADEGAAAIVPPLVADISRLVASAREDLRQLVTQARAIIEDDSPWLERASLARGESHARLLNADEQICAALEQVGAALLREAKALRLASSAEQARAGEQPLNEQQRRQAKDDVIIDSLEVTPTGDLRTTSSENLKGELRIWNRR